MNEQQQQANPASYFTKEIEEKMNSMTDDEMKELLKELQNSHYWIAMLKYNQARLGVARNYLVSGDPIKEPTAMARNQGVMLGISDLQNAVISLNQQAEEIEKGEEVN